MNLFILLLVLAVRRLDIGWTKSWVADNRIIRRLLPVVSWAQRNNKGNGVVWLLAVVLPVVLWAWLRASVDRKSTRLNCSHVAISYAVFCLKKTKVDVGHGGSVGGQQLTIEDGGEDTGEVTLRRV